MTENHRDVVAWRKRGARVSPRQLPASHRFADQERESKTKRMTASVGIDPISAEPNGRALVARDDRGVLGSVSPVDPTLTAEAA